MPGYRSTVETIAYLKQSTDTVLISIYSVAI